MGDGWGVLLVFLVLLLARRRGLVLPLIFLKVFCGVACQYSRALVLLGLGFSLGMYCYHIRLRLGLILVNDAGCTLLVVAIGVVY
jgi:hypothetical protein